MIIIVAAFLYAAPNLYGTDPAVQIMGQNAAIVDQSVLEKTRNALKKAAIPYIDLSFLDQTLLIRFKNPDQQMRAKEVIQEALGVDYVAALNLSSTA
ncbi:MAG TPA: protein translocase subunit SecD, partial [Myxococcota bacterium]|nr:protein translocase subunit SecD [Myxococcota bacterium]